MAEPTTPPPRSHVERAGGDAKVAARPRDGALLDVARRVAAGDGAAIAVLYEARFDAVFVAARRASGRDESFCLDVVQETFVRVMRSGRALASLRDAEHLERWLVRVAQTTALDLMRRERRRVRREKVFASGKHGVLDAARLEEHIAELEKELGALPAEERELLRLRWSGMTLAALAEVVGATTGVVHGRVRRATAMLRGAMRSTEVDHDA